MKKKNTEIVKEKITLKKMRSMGGKAIFAKIGVEGMKALAEKATKARKKKRKLITKASKK